MSETERDTEVKCLPQRQVGGKGTRDMDGGKSAVVMGSICFMMEIQS